MGIVIIGAGLAGATAATELRAQGYDGELTLVGAEPHLPYERPPLSKGYLLGNDTFESAFVHEADWYVDNAVDLRPGTRAVAIDRQQRIVLLEPVTPEATDDGSATDDRTGVVHPEPTALPYEQLLLATGSTPRPITMGHEAGGFLTLRTREDSDALRQAFQPGVRVAIVGAGWIGLEVAAAARQAGAEVTVFGRSAQPLERVLGPELGAVFADLHRAHGVDLRLGAEPTPDDLTGFDVRVAAIGVDPDIALAEAAGLRIASREQGGGVAVDAALRTSDPAILAIGDIANHDHPSLGRIRVEHWEAAIEQGRAAARTLGGDETVYDRQPYFFTDQYDLGMEFFGHIGAVGYDRVDIEGSTDAAAGDACRVYWVRDGLVVAAMHLNDWDASETIRQQLGSAR